MNERWNAFSRDELVALDSALSAAEDALAQVKNPTVIWTLILSGEVREALEIRPPSIVIGLTGIKAPPVRESP